MKVLKLLSAVIIVSLISTGCSSVPGRQINRPKMIDIYRSSSGTRKYDTAAYLSSNLNVRESIGYTKPYLPVLKDAEVRKVWIPAHKSFEDKNTLIGGHWVYVMVKEPRWFIDETQMMGQAKIPIIVPVAPEN